MTTIKAGIVGGAGYTAGELLRVLLNHPHVQVEFVNSSSNAGNRVDDLHEGLTGETDLVFTDRLPLDTIDVLFLCMGHGESRKFMESHQVPAQLKIVDLAMDYRWKAQAEDFVYGLPEVNRAAIAQSRRVANPGCFATCIQLGLLPLAQAGLLGGDITVNAITGSTGAGVKPSASSHFSWRNNNMSIYKPFVHQHLTEIGETLHRLQPGFQGSIDFIPYRGCFPRGIFATLLTRCPLDEQQALELYRSYYQAAPFVFVSDKDVDLKQVVNTNKCLLHLQKHNDKLLVTSCIDNLLKGASGQAVQNMNLLFGFDESAGLRLKSSAF